MSENCKLKPHSYESRAFNVGRVVEVRVWGRSAFNALISEALDVSPHSNILHEPTELIILLGHVCEHQVKVNT